MPLPLIAVMLLLLLLSAAPVVQQVSAFVVVPSGHFSVSVPSMIIIITTASPSTTKLALKKNKNFADEILDALDTMSGVSPLTETDLKRNQEGTTTTNKDGTSKNSSSNNEMLQQQQWLLQRQAQREQVAPPPDALQKPSVSIFFALLGIIPSLLLLYAVSFGGIKPFGL